MKHTGNVLISFILLFLAACQQKPTAENTADAIYFNGDLITMENDSATYIEAIAVKNGKIIFAGSKAEADKLQGDSTEMNDLAGNTMLPGFIDPHSHFINALSIISQANCSPSPVGNANNVAGIIQSLQSLQKDRNIPAGQLIIGYGYDDTVMPDSTLNRDDLDKAFPDNPVMVMHYSLHGCVLNSAAMKQFGFSAKTVTPPGGIIIRKPGTKEPYGLIMETAFLPIFSSLPKASPEQLKQQVKDGQMLYASAGVTSAQEGASHKADIDILQTAAAEKQLFIDIISFPFITDYAAVMKDRTVADFGKYNNHLKLGGIKITLDGSGPGRTAFFSTPYLNGGPGGEKNWSGSPAFPQAQVNDWVKMVYDQNIPLLMHANGDSAVGMAIVAHEYASAGNYTKDRRTTIIHSQFINKYQLGKFAEEKLIPSFFTEHTYFFADNYMKSRGPEQTSWISPMKSAIALGIHPTNHTDFNVFPIDQLFVVWTAVNRVSRSGKIIGAGERITPYQALQAITSNAAFQNFDENSKGSLTKGKLADLVVLDANPLKVDPMKIKDIHVIETIKEGHRVYKKS